MWYKEEYGSGYWFVMWHPSSAPYAVVADKGVLLLKVLHPLDIPALDKKLKKSFYNYGYGIKFISADNTKEQKCGNQREEIESRKHPRKPYSKSVLYVANNQILEGMSQNISLSGIFLKTKDKLRVGQTIFLSLPSKTKKGLKIRRNN